MGTSKSYSASIKGQPQWGELSRSVTSNCGNGIVSTKNLNTVLGRYVNVIGGATKAGRGSSKIGGRAGVKAARNLGAVLGAFAGGGGISGTTAFDALEKLGLNNLRGKTLSEVIDQLIEYCCGPSSTIDEVAAKTATQKILEELALEADTVESFQEQIQTILSQESIEDVLIKFFGYYVFEHLSIMFYEKLVSEKGKSNCSDLFRQIKEFILERLKNVNRVNPLKNIDWKSDEADRIIKNIQVDVLKIFEGYEN